MQNPRPDPRHDGPSEPRPRDTDAAGDERPASVLVADDDADHRNALAHLLRHEGFHVRVAGSGEDALKLAVADVPDVAILDVDMPGLDGFATCRELLEVCSPPPTLLFVSGYATVADAVHGVELGGFDYIGKPYDPAHLLAKVRAAVRIRRELDSLRARVAVDPLTGLWNRAECTARCDAVHALSERTRRPFACLMLDVDRFKLVNDGMGHAVGDAVLQEVARRLQQTSRQADSVFRMGGEEFLVLAPESDLAAAMKLGERLRLAVWSKPFQLCAASGEPVQRLVSVSVGVASWSPGRSVEELLVAADAALYAAKEGGRNRVRAAES